MCVCACVCVHMEAEDLGSPLAGVVGDWEPADMVAAEFGSFAKGMPCHLSSPIIKKQNKTKQDLTMYPRLALNVLLK